MVAVATALAIALAAPQRTPRSADLVAALQTACAGEDPRACAELARRYRAGDGVSRDPDEKDACTALALQKGCSTRDACNVRE
ncbi:MAG: hypothetical protein E6J66_01515 [Deltaproteobacteria bacterium]|jgi:TPR repeat protein|nr:MAG: hypothetical protein E6J66_01515 [Deltaproteobacteria bacterium]